MSTCGKCGHPKAKHRYGHGPCNDVDMHSQRIYDVDHPHNGREVRSEVVFCGCKKFAGQQQSAVIARA